MVFWGYHIEYWVLCRFNHSNQLLRWFLVENIPGVKLILQLLMTLNRIFKKFYLCFFAEPPKFGPRFLLLSGSGVLQMSLFNAISALSSVKGARAFLIDEHFLTILAIVSAEAAVWPQTWGWWGRIARKELGWGEQQRGRRQRPITGRRADLEAGQASTKEENIYIFSTAHRVNEKTDLLFTIFLKCQIYIVYSSHLSQGWASQHQNREHLFSSAH